MKHDISRLWKDAGGILTLAVVYVLSAWLGLKLAIPPGFVTVFWPPSGFALAAVYVFGYRYAIGVFAGAFFVDTMNFFGLDETVDSIGFMLNTALIATGVTIQSCVGAWLVRRFIGSSSELVSFRDILLFATLAGPLACSISATWGSLSLYLGGIISAENALYSWANWYVGDILGVLIFSPIIVILFSKKAITFRRKLSVVLPLLIIFTVVIVSFGLMRKIDTQSDVEKFRGNTHMIIMALKENLYHRLLKMEAMRSLYHSSDNISEDEFYDFASSLSYHYALNDVITSVAYAPLSYDEGRCHPYCANVQMVYPRNVEKDMLGNDLTAIPAQKEALEQVLANGGIAISGPLDVFIEAGVKKPGFTVFAAIMKNGREDSANRSGLINHDDVILIEKNDLEGVIVSSMTYQDIMDRALSGWDFFGIKMRLYDITDGHKTLLFYSDAKNAGSEISDENGDVNAYHSTYEFTIGGRVWLYEFYVDDEYVQANINWVVWFGLAASLVFTFLTSVFLLAVTGYTARVEQDVKEKTTEISHQNEFMNMVMNSVPDLIYVKDEKSKIIQANRAFHDFYDRKNIKDILGSTGFDLLPEEQAERLRKMDELALENGWSRAEERVIGSAGEMRDYILSKVSFTTPEGARYLLVVARDVTEEKEAVERLKASEERFRASLENAPIGMALVDMQQNWIVYNEELCKMSGYSMYELGSMNLKEMVHPEDVGKDKEELRALLNGSLSNYSIEKRYLRKNGSTLWTLLSLSLVRKASGEAAYFVAQVMDISERKTMEEDLRRSNRELENFAYVASHDLKAPLRHIGLSAGFLKETYRASLDKQGNDMIDIMVRAVDRMQQMIDSLLAYSRVGRKGAQEKFMPVAMHDVVNEAIDSLTLLVSEQNTDISVQDMENVTVNGNKMLLIQLFQNLIQNAIKYRKDGVVPEVRIEAHKEGHFWMFSVSDNGIGIGAEHAEKIFNVFQRLHSDGEYEGTGIGLSVCQRIVEFHGGKIWLDTDYKDGSRFVFCLSGL